MKITSQMVKELRDKTSAGMMDCKKALTETDGNIEKANKYLGRNYIIDGKVVSGVQRGRLLGFPTANIQLNDNQKLIPSIAGLYVDSFLVV